jgi:tetratricopeptide (TPR) repeat protein
MSTEDERPGPVLRWGVPLAVLVLAFCAFWPALSQGFVELDDDRNFQHNPNFHGLSAENLEWMFTESWYGHYQPLSWVTLAIDYSLYGDRWPDAGAGYHRTNMIFHALGALVLFLLIRALLRPLFEDVSEGRLTLVSGIAALLHAVHPLRVESVAWATERRDVQSGLFLLLAVYAYVRYVRGGRNWGWAWFLLSLATFVLSLLSKAWGITLPAVLFVLDACPLRRRAEGTSWVRLALEKLLYVGPALFVAWRAAGAQGEAFARMSLADHSVIQRCAQAGYGLMFYVFKSVWPANLSALYWLELEFDPFRPLYLATGALVVAVTGALVVLRRRWPAGLATWVVYALVASPVLGFLQSGFQKTADRYTYLACIPFAVLAGAGLAQLASRDVRKDARAPFTAVAAGAGLLVALLAVLTFNQTRVWRDSESLYRRVVTVEPDNYFGWHNLAVILHKQGRYDEAIEAELHSIEHHQEKGNVLARFNLGNLYRLTGQSEKALEAFSGAAEVSPDHLDSLLALKTEHLRQGDFDGACAWFERAVEYNPQFVDGWKQWADIRRGQLKRPEAIAVWERAAEVLQPPAGWGRDTLEGWPYEHELATRQRAAVPRHGLGVLYLDNNRVEEAGAWLEPAFYLDNRNFDYAIDYARFLARAGQRDLAVNLITQVLSAAPTNGRAQLVKRALDEGRPP